MEPRQEGVLSGMRVVEYASFVAGPYLSRQLAEFGASVIKVEEPGTGDKARHAGPFEHDRPSLDTSLLFNYLNVNKQGITLDLNCSTGRELLLKLLESADIFIYGGLVKDMENLRLGHKDVSLVNPNLVGTYVTPFGLTGPYRHWKSNELVTVQMSGLAHGTPGGLTDLEKPPLKPGGRHGLMLAGLYGALATMHALFARDASGTGQEVEVSELEPLTSQHFGGINRYAFTKEPDVRGEGQGGGLYPAKDGTLAINPMQDYMWEAMVKVMGSPEWASRPEFATRPARTANSKEMRQLVGEWTSQLPKAKVFHRLQDARVPAFPGNSVADVLDSPHMRARGFFETIPLPSGGTGVAPGPRYKFAEGVVETRTPAPKLGEHTEQVLKERIGLSQQELVTLFECGVI